MQYKLEKYVEGEWWYHGAYRSVRRLAAAAFEIGMGGWAEAIRVTEVPDENR